MRTGQGPASARSSSLCEPARANQNAPAPLRTQSEPSPEQAHGYSSATFRIRPRFLVGENTSAGTLSAVAGFVDVAGFVAVFGLFPAHLTGQLVVAAAAISEGQHAGVLRGLGLIPMFVLAVCMATVVSRLARRRGIPALTSLLGLMACTLAVFWLIGTLLAGVAAGPEDWATFFIGGSAVLAMGVQNALMREALGKCCPTTMMTGNLTQLIILLVEPLISTADERRQEQSGLPSTHKLLKVSAPLIGFGCGAGLGAWLISAFGLISIIVPTLVVSSLCAITWRQQRERDTL